VDKRLKPIDPATDIELKTAFFEQIRRGELSIAEAVKGIRRLSRLTQPEFAKHRGISLDSLRSLEAGTGNPSVEIINKVVAVFGMELGVVFKNK
jgi:DNA-binding XRE family transcriptional regulator